MRSRRLVPLAALAWLGPGLVSAQKRDGGIRLGFSVERLARIDTVVQGAVDRGEMAGAVALVLRDGQPQVTRFGQRRFPAFTNSRRAQRSAT